MAGLEEYCGEHRQVLDKTDEYLKLKLIPKLQTYRIDHYKLVSQLCVHIGAYKEYYVVLCCGLF